MVYMAGQQDHKVGTEEMIDHLVTLVEERASRIEAESRHNPHDQALYDQALQKIVAAS